MTHQNRIKMELGNLPQEIAQEIENNQEVSQLVQLAERILNQGDRENASKILDLVLEA
jgi:Tfp pilus assembly protein FimV